MSLKDEITKDVKAIFKDQWEVRDGKVIPDDQSLTLKNESVKISATVLYADLAESTNIVKTNVASTAAEIYKSFLLSICKVIRSSGGEITAFDGDRVMAVFINNNKNTSAAAAALKINWIIDEVVQKEFSAFYKDSTYKFKYCVGVDTSELFVAKTGVRGANDLVWVGNAANIAAKISSLRGTGYKAVITESVYSVLADSSKFGGTPSEDMWTQFYNKELNLYLYGSSWRKPVS